MQSKLIELSNIPNTKSPLWYPGGKRRLWKYLEQYLPTDLTHLISPFIGGGAIELACTGKGIKVQASDNFEPLTNFWNYYINDSSSVIDIALDMYPLSFEERVHYDQVELGQNCSDINNKVLSDLERAAVYFCINKQSFRSWGLAAKPSRTEVFKSVSYFEKWRTWKNDYIKVTCSDYIPVIENANGTFLYCDPPYVEKEYFYGSSNDRSPFDHQNLSDMLHKTKSKWILSYGRHPLILELYKKYTIIEPKWTYTIRKHKDLTSKELLILNL